jgi:hypothetical protein
MRPMQPLGFLRLQVDLDPEGQSQHLLKPLRQADQQDAQHKLQTAQRAVFLPRRARCVAVGADPFDFAPALLRERLIKDRHHRRAGWHSPVPTERRCGARGG